MQNKKFLSQFLFLFISFNVLAGGIPQRLHFQAIARDTKGALVTNTRIQVRLSIMDSADAGKLVYREYQTPVTDNYGTIDIQVNDPDSSVQIGTNLYSNIPWQTGNKWLKIEYQAVLGPTYTLIGLFPMLPVPYAVVSQTALQVDGVDFTNPKDGDVLKYNAATGKWVHGQDNGTNYYAGKGISIGTGDTLINTAPNQVVSIKATGTSKISGSYPNFTIHSDTVKPIAGNGIRVGGDTISNLPSIEYAMFADTESTGGGTAKYTGWQTRKLNLKLGGSGISIKLNTDNSFTLSAGTYLIDGSVPGMDVDYHHANLYDSTNSKYVLFGSSEKSYLGSDAQTRSMIKGIITISKTTVYRIEHYTSYFGADGLGTSSNGAAHNVFTQLFIQRLR